MTNTKQDSRVYTEGVCGDGAMILRDGQPFPISSAIDALNAYTSTEALRSALEAAEQFIVNGVEFGFIRMPDPPDSALDTLPKLRAALSASPPPSSRSLGYLYFNPDTGTEFSENHPIESGECDDAENVREATAEALRDELLDAWREREDAEVELARRMEPVKMSTLTEAQIKNMVDRFLSWKLPKTFSPDGGISFERIAGADGPHPFTNEPSGTNLLCATEATEMVRHMLNGLPGGSPAPSTEGLREWLPIAGAPKDQNIIVAAMNTYSKTWIVGEARWEYDNRGDGDWWWANTCPGDYAADSIFNMNGAVEFWQPLPPAPDAARTALAGVTASDAEGAE